MKRKLSFIQWASTAVASFILSGAIAGCSSDDEPDGATGAGYITIDGKTTNFISGVIHFDDEDDDIDIELISIDPYTANIPDHYDGDVNISFRGDLPDGHTITITPEQYEIEFDRDIVATDDPEYEGHKPMSAWAWLSEPLYNNTKKPGNLTVSRKGSNYTISIENLWVYGGKGCDSWSNMELDPAFAWAQGTLKWSGKLINISDEW